MKYGNALKAYVIDGVIVKASMRDKLLGLSEEFDELYMEIGKPIRKVWSLNGSKELADVFLMAGREIGDLEFEHEKPLEKDLKRMADEISKSTGRYLEKAVLRGIEAGNSIDDIANQISSISAFAGYRAVRIARTESTRALNRSSNNAYIQAKKEGIRIMKEWLTADDDLVREEHRVLEGTIIDVEDEFESDGEFASGPGEFGAAYLTVNCRCSILPVVEED